MEGLLIILILAAWIIGPIRLLRWVTGKAASLVAPESSLAGSLNSGSLTVSISRELGQFGDAEFECLKVKMRGTISAPFANYSYQVVTHLLDVTDGEEKPVLCAIDQLQEQATTAFEYRTETMALPYSESVISSWMPVVSIPLDVINTARSGERTIKCRVDVVSANEPPIYVLGRRLHAAPRSILASAEKVLDVSFAEAGYEDRRESREVLDGLTLKLAMAVSSSDGNMDESEGEIIRQWLKKKIAHLEDGEYKNEEKERYNRIVAEAYEAAKTGINDIPGLCRQVKEIATTGDCYDIVELCLHVAAADGEAQGVELQLTRGIANFLAIDLNRLRALEEKIVPVYIHSDGSDSDNLLGISVDMSPEEIRKHLNQEYRKWNSRSAHKDPAIRDQAEQMLKIIAEARRKYVS